ncbi:two-partner secretion domain-containing protein [Inhella proteolytica]|uniref:Filamentous hemagglutinin N-terminal domain-containing protein n=1 Tax=Inhella proteolytica TaxID=2795029 RepID=A0A931J7M6_9BURK|nr:caspase family protein [Inhella proteolytica]MBH9579283.1 filamentous hemagglutinin N-terminal domain-containing protein [Inhella proteolytica]
MNRFPTLRPLARALIALCCTPALAATLPAGLQVQQGQAQLQQQGNQLTVRNSPNAILNWQSFSIGPGAGVYFEQANASSKVLNRVVGSDPSQILGSLGSNGQVWLLNPHGVLFGAGARVDVASLVTSTLSLSDADFISGRYRFSADQGASLRNEGQLRGSLGGQIVLLGGRVENTGSIEAGQVQLAAARQVELVDSGAPNLAVRVDVPAGEVLNLGALSAPGGRIDVHAASVNQQGLVQADSLGTDAQGRIVLQASQRLSLGAGSVTAAAGGEIQLLGQEVALLDGTRADTSAPAGGGRIYVGGGAGGRDAALPNARAVYMGPQAELRADATQAGDGGSIWLWSNEATRAYGHFSAQGGPQGGNGGFVETSGGWLDARPAGLNLQAPGGRAGNWLIDPNNILVSDTASNTNISAGPLFTSTGDDSTIATATIAAALNAGNSVTIATASAGANSQAGDITVDGMNLVVAPPAGVSLTFDAHRHIGMRNSRVQTTGNPLNLFVQAARGSSGAIAIVDSVIDTRGGNVTIGSQTSRQLEFEGGFTPDAYAAALADLTSAPFAPASRIGIYLNGSLFDLGSGTFSAQAGTATSVGGRATAIRVDGTGVNPMEIRARVINMVGAAGSGPLVAGTVLPERGIDLRANTHLIATDRLWLRGFGGSGVRGNNARLTLNASSSSAELRIDGQINQLAEFGGAGVSANAYSGPALITATGGTVTLVSNRSSFISGSAADEQLLDAAAASLVRLEGTNRGVSLGAGILRGPSNGVFELVGPQVANSGFVQIIDATVQAGGRFSASAGRMLLTGSEIVSSGAPLNINLESRDSRLAVFDSRLAAGGGAIGLRALGGFGELPGEYGDHAFGIQVRDSQLSAPGPTGRIEMSGVAPDPASPELAGQSLALVGVALLNSNLQAETIELTGSSRNGAGHSGMGVAVYERSTLSGGTIRLTGTGADDFGVRLANNAGTVTATKDLILTGRESLGTSATIEVAGPWRLSAGSTLLLDGTGNSVGLENDTQGAGTPQLSAGSLLHLKLTERAPNAVVSSAELRQLGENLRDMPSAAVTRITIEGQLVSFAGVLGIPSRLQLAIDDFTLLPGAALRSTAPGDAITLLGADGSSPMQRFSNEAGADALQTPNGRWLVFMDQGSTGSLGALSPSFTQYSVSPAAFSRDASGNLVVGAAGSGAFYRSGPPSTSASVAPAAVDTQVALGTALTQSAPLVQLSTPSEGRTLDALPGVAQGSGGTSFTPINSSQMSRAELITLLAARDNYKKKVFADALHRLQLDPALADVRPCTSEPELASGQCLITEALKAQIQAARLASTTPQAAPAAKTQTGLERLRRAQARKVREAALPTIARKVALLIGVNDYQDDRVADLSGALDDVRAMQRLLEEQLGYETLTLENASKEAMVRALNQLALETDGNDSVLIYYAGHGVVEPSANMGYWLPADSRADQPQSWLSNADIARLVGLIGARQTLLVSDSCYSGTLAGSEKVQVDRSAAPDSLLSRKAVVVLSSGGNEPVADTGRDGHSVFAWHLMERLKQLSAWQIGNQLYERVRFEVAREFPQTPRYGAARAAGHQDNTDYLFEKRSLEK